MDRELLMTYMERKQWTVSQLARELGVSRQTIYNWVRGAYPVPKWFLATLNQKELLGGSNTRTVERDDAVRV